MIRKEDIVKIGQFAKPHGIKGEISLVTDFDLFENKEESYIICDLDGLFVPFFIEEFRYKSDTVVLLKLENLNSGEDVKPFSNKDVYCPKEWIENSTLDTGITWDNFIGYKLFDTGRGYLGVIDDVDATTMNVLFRIDDGGNELLIPVAEELVTELDHVKKVIVMSVPPGLFEL